MSLAPDARPSPAKGSPPDDPSRATLRHCAYLLLSALSLGAVTGRLLSLNSVDQVKLQEFLRQEGYEDWRRERPFLSANDRSRWCTVRSLVEHGTYEIDKIVAQPNWGTIDMVKHKSRRGEERLYSSKPPLLATLVAGVYWPIYHFTRFDLENNPHGVGRTILFIINILPLGVYFLYVARLAERFGQTDFSRIFAMAAAAFGTYLTTYAVTLNNHLPAAVSAAIALWYGVRIWCDGSRSWRHFALAGFFAAFTAANELPALSFFAALSAALLWKAPRQTLLAYTPPALVVVAAFFATNYIAHNTFYPPYFYRSKTNKAENWYEYEYIDAYGEKQKSYWYPEIRRGIDRGEPSRAVYAFHVLVGHHGILSLTPIWILSLVGAGMMLRGKDRAARDVALLIGVISVVCVAYYLARPLEDRNYGGVAAGFRWVIWFAPLWLVLLLPAADLLARRTWLKVLGAALLAVSVLSVSYHTWNPWTHPWLWDYTRDVKPSDS
jgi:hypothetical protein